MSKLENIYINIIKFGTYIILFVPLLISKEFFFPYIFGKAIIIRSIIEIMAAVYILLVLLNRRYKPKFSLLFWGVVVFMGVKVLSTIFGVSIYHSFWSNYERMEGLLTILHFGAFFVILSGVFKKKEEWLALLRVELIASCFIALYGLGQKLGISVFRNQDVIKIDSTLGNSSYVAIYLVMNFFIAIYLLIKTRDRLSFWRRVFGRFSELSKIENGYVRVADIWAVFYGLELLFFIVIIYFTASRGGFMALLLSLFLLGVFLLFWAPSAHKTRSFKTIILVMIVLMVGFVAAIYFNKDSSWVSNNYYLRRFASISRENATVKDRLINWRIGFSGFKDRPILGFGPENYYVPFNKYYDSRTSEAWFDRAHNIIFDQLNSSGVLGLAAYLFIIWVAFTYLWKKRKDDFWLAAVFMAMIFGYFFANLFVFDNSTTYTVFFLILAFINFTANESKTDDTADSRQNRPISFFIPIVLTILLAGMLYIFNIEPAIANDIALEGYKYSHSNPSKALVFFKRALAYNTFGNAEIRLRVGDYAMALMDEKGDEDKGALEAMRFAIEESKRSIEKDEPLNVRLYLHLGSLYNELATTENKQDNLKAAFKYLNQAKDLSPNRLEVYFQLAQSALASNDLTAATAYMEKAYRILPENVDVQYNLFLMRFYTGDQAKIDEQFAIIKEFGIRNLRRNQADKLVDNLYSVKLVDKAAQALEDYLQGSPNPELYAKLAALYAELGDKEKARAATMKAVELKPDFKADADAFLKTLGD